MLQFAAAKAALGAMPWKLIGLSALAMFILGLMLALSMERRQNDKLKVNIAKLESTLRSISDKKNEQGKATDRNIGKARERIVYVDREARKIEAAPILGSCKTPEIIMRSPDL